MDVDFRREAYRHTRKSSAPGIDGVTAPQYAAPLDEHLHDLHERRRSGRDQAPPVERVWSEKADGKQRPLGQPTCEDTIVQRAVAMRLEAIDAQDFSEGSYGFWQGRSPHDALHEHRERCMRDNSGWIVDAEGSGSFDSIERTRLRDVRRQRVEDGSIRRLMGKWLRAGGIEDGILRHPETGVVQGGVIAPVLAHICLHQVLDAWCAQAVQPRRPGRCCLMRFADDCVMGCEAAADARRIMDVLPKRCARSGLTMHPTQTTLSAVRKPAARQGSADGSGTVDVLELTHDWTKSRRGCWVIKRRTARKRLRRTKQSLWRWCRIHRPAPRQDQYQQRCQK
jgi:RNA-directed DNA polymerase